MLIDMRNMIKYLILVLVGLVFSCQRAELLETEINRPGMSGYDEVTFTFSALLPEPPGTKAMGDSPDTDIQSMHLVVFDQNGMLVETREASITTSSTTHGEHLYESEFSVTLTVTDQPRFIHFIANCPIDQISYGHEISIIGNMYVEKDNDPSTPETAYWARIEVPYILFDEVVEGDQVYFVPDETIVSKFQCVPMLRNYSQVVVIDDTGDSDPFEFLGFTIYNTIDMGTVAPYNNNIQAFQSFLDTDGSKYSYPELTELNYKGHALAAVELITELPKDNDGNYLFWDPYHPSLEPDHQDNANSIFYMYERKISARTDEEEKWDESPPHVIIKGRYGDEEYYYKVDLVYEIIDDKGTPSTDDDVVTDIKYYNILRNFRYQFTITEVAGEGYKTVEEAVQGATSNNLSGSSTTAKFTNISDKVGRLWVSYTDTTLVNNDQITLKYKYVPNINSPYTEDNSKVTIEDLLGGDVIENYTIADADIEGGYWDGYREVTLGIKAPSSLAVEQTIKIKTDNANLSREVRYYLKNRYALAVECTPLVAKEVGAQVQVDIKLPPGLTDDMFPLDLAIEVYDMTLSPNALMNTLPVETGESVIPVPEKIGTPTFHYVKTLDSLAVYRNLASEGNWKVLPTYWYTNKVDNASTVYVVNKYFNTAYDDFENDGVSYTFSDVHFTTDQVACGIGHSVSASFTMDSDDQSYASREITVVMNGLADNLGNSTFTVMPTQGSRIVTISGLTTTSQTQNLSFSVHTDDYSYGYAYVGRRFYKFNGYFSQDHLEESAGVPATYNFSIPSYTEGMIVNVTLNGLAPASSETKLSGSGGSYVFTPTGAGNYSFALETLNSSKGTCSVTLEAEEYFYETEISSINQFEGYNIEELRISFVWDHSNDPEDDTVSGNIQLSINEGSIIKPESSKVATSHNNANDRTYTTVMKDVVIVGASENSLVTISYTGSSNYNSYTYSAQMRVAELLQNPVVTLIEN